MISSPPSIARGARLRIRTRTVLAAALLASLGSSCEDSSARSTASATSAGRAIAAREDSRSACRRPGDALFEIANTAPPLASVGDVDGDGTADLLARRWFDVPFHEGLSPAVVPHGEAVQLVSGRTGELLQTLWGTRRPDADVAMSLAGGGDVDADGVPDVVVGFPLGAEPPTDQALVVVYSGRDGTELHRVTGRSSHLFGARVAIVADCDYDGHADFAVEMPGREFSVVGRGRGWNSALGLELRGEGYGILYSGRTGAVLRERAELALFREPVDGADSFALGDFTGDGTPEYAVGCDDRTFVFDGSQLAAAPEVAISRARSSASAVAGTSFTNATE